MASASYNIIIEQGSRFKLEMTITDENTAAPIDLSNQTGTMKISSKDGKSTILLISGDSDTTKKVQIIDGPNGKALVSIDPSVTQSIPCKNSATEPMAENEDYIYTLDIGGDRYLRGFVSVLRG